VSKKGDGDETGFWVMAAVLLVMAFLSIWVRWFGPTLTVKAHKNAHGARTDHATLVSSQLPDDRPRLRVMEIKADSRDYESLHT
jgi:hypothetical protein